MIPKYTLLDDFAFRSFRDLADADYIAARMACRAALVFPFLWSSQQAIEKYLKCILLLNRVRAVDIGHDLSKAIARIKDSRKVDLELTASSTEFISRLDSLGVAARYFEASFGAAADEVVLLDQAVWDVRRCCSLEKQVSARKPENDGLVPRVRLPGGLLEKIADNKNDRAREPLLWQNGFFGEKRRRHVRPGGWFQVHIAPVPLNPHILDKVLRYVKLPKSTKAAYRALPGKSAST